ncbi:acyltransferase family protein [Larkinella soli]|uniref:acyltransferase family protein n=1 Tax=Larkinella soli TaxID=1770527 RepID=UPI000FFB43D4|nr:acyltransferase [Larkinella soli]
MPQLDALRAFAVSFVLIFHWFPQTSLLNILPNGSIGVTLFFVLSGFLITQILIKNRNEVLLGHSSLSEVYKNFIIRRALRIFPIYYLFLLFIYFFLPQTSDLSRYPAYYFLYAYNLLLHQTGNWADMLSPFWTLSAEEQFYLVWPTVVLMTPRPMLRNVIIVTILLGVTSRVLWALNGNFHGVLTPTCLDAFGIGALWSHTVVEQPETMPLFRKRLLWATLLAFVAFLYLVSLPYTSFFKVFQRTLLSVLSLYFVVHASFGFKGPAGRFMTHPALVYMGRISYGIYVYHMVVSSHLTPPVLSFLSRFSPVSLDSPGIHRLISFVLLLLIATLSWYLIEKPFNDLKRYFSYSKSAA